MPIVVTPPSIQHRDNQTLISTRIGSSEAWVAIDAPWAVRERLQATLYPFAPIALIDAAARGRAIHFDGDIEDSWWTNLVGAFLPLVAKLYDYPAVPATRSGPRVRCIEEPGESGLMFSAGVDSFYSKGLCSQVGTSPDWFVNINAGAHDLDRSCWAKRIANVTEVANAEQIGIIIIDTNFHEIVPLDHIRVHIIRNLCASFALFPAINHLVYSSGHDYSGISFALGKSRGLDHIGHAVIASLMPAPLSLAYLGWNATRVEKTQLVALDPLAARHLSVCTNQQYQSKQYDSLPLNCGECDKCIRTMLTLEYLGELDKFYRAFPITDFRARAEKLLADLAKSPLPTDREVAELFINANKGRWIRNVRKLFAFSRCI